MRTASYLGKAPK